MALADPPELLFDPGLRVLLLSGVTYGLPASRSCHGLLGTPPPPAPTLTLALLLLLQIGPLLLDSCAFSLSPGWCLL